MAPAQLPMRTESGSTSETVTGFLWIKSKKSFHHQYLCLYTSMPVNRSTHANAALKENSFQQKSNLCLRAWTWFSLPPRLGAYPSHLRNTSVNLGVVKPSDFRSQYPEWKCGSWRQGDGGSFILLNQNPGTIKSKIQYFLILNPPNT